MSTIPESFRDLFEKKTIAHVATLLPDGRPHNSPVWIDYDPEWDRLLVNSERGRRKVRNVEHDPRVSVSMVDPDDHYRRMTVVGTADAVTEEGARSHIDKLSRRYSGIDYPHPIEAPRVLIPIRPDEGVAQAYVGDRAERSDLRQERFACED
jgi:PPOX class probable F420-dependent enzyme